MPDIFAPEDTKHEEKVPTGHAPKPTREVSPIPTTTPAMPPANENHLHALATYCTRLPYLLFHGKDITSEIRLFVRRHIVTNIPWILTTIALLLIPPLLQFIITLSPTTPTLPANFVSVFLLFYYLIVAMYVFLSFLNWFYNIIIITTTEIIDIDYADIIYHDVAATNVNLIEDVQYVQSGFIQGLFNFGNVFVQTAGGKENIEALAIPRPAEIARFILSYIGKGDGG